jgi:hypothetical protein
MSFLLKHKLTLMGLAMGALGGYVYYYFVGCAAGTCAITSNPLNSTLYGAILGGLTLHSFEKENNNSSNNQNQQSNE